MAEDKEWSSFPRGLSACVRELFSRVTVMDPVLVSRLSDWLSLHLSNLNFIWPWQKWKSVTKYPDYDPQYRFVKSALRKLVYLADIETLKEVFFIKE